MSRLLRRLVPSLLLSLCLLAGVALAQDDAAETTPPTDQADAPEVQAEPPADPEETSEEQAAPAAAQAGPPATLSGKIASIVITGTRRIEDAAIRARIDMRQGEALSSWAIRRDIRSIFRSGLVDDVQVDVSPAPDGEGMVVAFIIVEKPAVRAVKIAGNKKIDEDDIREVIDIPAFAVLNEADVKLNLQRIRDLYIEKGYFLAEVVPEVKEVAEHQVELTFDITENRKVLVSNIDISGNDNLPDRKIRRYMQTKQAGVAPWLTNSGTFLESNLENDVYVVRSVYLEEGYVDVKVDPPRVYLSPDKRNIYINIHVEEGVRYRLGKIDVDGEWVPHEGLTREAVQRLIEGESLDEVERDNRREIGETVAYYKGAAGYGSKGATAARDALQTGEWFALTQLQAVMQDISDLYADQGYAFVNVVPLTETDPERQIVDITFDIQKGEKVSIGRIDISGNDPTFDKVVRREVPINEGDWYSGRAIKEARARLERLGFFEEVRISTPRGDGDNVLDMNLEVTEQPTGSFSAQAGFSNLENFVFGLNVSKNNFLGLGYVMSAAVNLSSRRQQGNLSFFDPYFLDSRWTLQVNAYALSRQWIEDEYQQGGSIAIGRYMDARDDVRLTMDYTIENAGLNVIDSYKKRILGGELYRSGLTSTLGLNLNIDKRNNRIMATRGYYTSLASELSGGFRLDDDTVLSVLGGQFNFWESRFNFRYFKPISPGGEWAIFRYNLTLGYIRSTDGTVLPYIHRYRAGGINSVRGFDWYSLGPSIRGTGYRSSGGGYLGSSFIGSDDPTAADDRLVVGGTETWINNIEIEFPIVKAAGISTVVFFDAGNAFGDPWGNGHINPLDLRTSYGMGVRWFSPLGPLRFEWGFPIKPEEGERKAVFDFSIGSFF
jgi:outer membrane protein insertion porin family